MKDEMCELDLVYGEQFRATELQVYNWGTFQGIHRMEISPLGHLVVGASGAGKSSLLDAIATILTPFKWHDLNAAARDQERKGKDRSVASYVRGAYSQSQDGETGEISTRFLRPEATWSALALTFDNGLGRIFTLSQLLWIRGVGTKNADVRHLYFIFDRPFRIEEFSSFDLDPRKIKKSFPGAFCEEEFSLYQERFMRDLGIAGENALRLLHKTQSAKNLGDLNAFMRDFMLDEPSTFETANAMVDEFGKLDEAHNALIDARLQIELLRPARDDLGALHERQSEAITIADILDRMDEWINAKKREIYEHKAAELRLEQSKLSGSISTQEQILEAEKRSLEDLRTRYREEGGAALEGWQRELDDLRRDRERKGRTLRVLQEVVATMNRAVPETQEAFAELKAIAQNILERWQDPSSVHAGRQVERDRLRDEKASHESSHLVERMEYESLQRQPTNIPYFFLEKRAEIARNAGLPESSLPFVGELIKVKDDEESWEGAIQRVLRGFSLSVLVSDIDWPKLARSIDDHNLGFRLVYYRVSPLDTKGKPQATRPDRLPGKLEIKECVWRDWLVKELEERFSYACVTSSRQLNEYDRAVTIAGQVRHGKERFEKDDRAKIDDRSQWTLGFRNETKLATFLERIRKSERRIAELRKQIEAIEVEWRSQGVLANAAGRIIDIEWQDIDIATIVSRTLAIEENIAAAFNKGSNLETLSSEIVDKEGQIRSIEIGLREVYGAREALQKEAAVCQREAQRLADLDLGAIIPKSTLERLETLFQDDTEELSLEGLIDRERKARRQLGDRKEKLAAEAKGLEDRVLEAFRRYKERWPIEGKDLEPSLDGAEEYRARLDKLEYEDLPSHEARFADYLREQSYKHLTELSTRIERNRRDIRRRMDIVNESLAQGKFGNNTKLFIETVDRKIPEVREFFGSLRDIQDRALDAGKEEAEAKFLRLRALIYRLRSPEGPDQRWRDLVLDVRNHVEFLAHEVNENGERVQSYRSGAGKSGGQRQRLATTCLAAALRYQLGGAKQGKPRFAMISMDEAFDKADNEFTARVMEIFRNFGFQMIMATPNKAVMSLEPYIGGACYVGIKDERDSRLLPIGIVNRPGFAGDRIL